MVVVVFFLGGEGGRVWVFSTPCSCTRVTKPQCVTRELHSSSSQSELSNSLMYISQAAKTHVTREGCNVNYIP